MRTLKHADDADGPRSHAVLPQPTSSAAKETSALQSLHRLHHTIGNHQTARLLETGLLQAVPTPVNRSYRTGKNCGETAPLHPMVRGWSCRVGRWKETQVPRRGTQPPDGAHRIARYEAGEHAQLGETGDQLRQSLGATSYLVVKGERAEQIAERFGVGVNDLKSANKEKLRKWLATDGSGRIVEGFNAGETITVPPKLNEMQQGLVHGKAAEIVVNGVTLPYGVVIAMGDLFESPAQMASASPDELQELSALIQREQQGGKAVTTEEWVKATKGRYLELAKKNVGHFGPTNPAIAPSSAGGGSAENHKTEWEKHHVQAVEASRVGKKDEALAINAFGDHFLTDAFSAGHLINKPDVMDLFKGQIKTMGNKFDAPSTAFFDFVANKAFTGDVRKTFSEYETAEAYALGWHPNINSPGRFSQLLQGIYKEEPDLLANAVAKGVHDALNRFSGGVPVENARGDKWPLSGDATLNAETKKVALQAVAQSQLNVASLYKSTATPNYADLCKKVWDFTPRLTPESTVTIQELVNKSTSIKDEALIDSVVSLINDNYLLIVHELVNRKKLRKA